MMASAKLKKKVKETLKQAYFDDADDLVDISEGPAGGIHVVVVSRKFDGRDLKQKNDLIWAVLSKHLKPEEWGQITLTVGTTPEEIKAF